MAVLFPRSIGPVLVDVVVSESATASMEIPAHPVERGAKISDHAWRLQTTLKMECLNGDVTSTWQALNDLMAEAEPFDIVTGFDLFPSMMIESLEPTRDVTWSNILSLTVSFKEIVIVDTEAGGGNIGTGGDERGQGITNRGSIQARGVDLPAGISLPSLPTLPSVAGSIADSTGL